MTIEITKHASERLKSRTNFTPQQAKEVAEKAYYCGKDIDDFPKKIRQYLSNVLEASSGNCLKVLGNEIYLFGNGVLITVFPIPAKILRDRGNKK